MATMNPAAIQKTVKALTNQKTLASVLEKFEKIDILMRQNRDCENDAIELAGAILRNPAGEKLVDYLVGGDKAPQQEEASFVLAALITAVRTA